MYYALVLLYGMWLPVERAAETSVTETGIDFASFGLC